MTGHGLLSVAEALARILDGVEPMPVEEVALEAASGRVLARPIVARLTQPPFDAAAMDGYAVRAADIATLPATLDLIGEASAGHGFDGTLGAGQCVRIFTGAPVPDGADVVVMQEDTARDGAKVTIVARPSSATHVRPRGGDFAQGQALLAAGHVLTPRSVTLAAAMGQPTLTVYRRPRVAILSTGDELVAPGTMPGPDQIVASNSYGLAAMVAAAGGAPQLLGIARDTRQDIETKLALAEGADVLVTSGGASVGEYDLVAPALEARGMKLGFWKIAMRPGKPLIFGRIGTQRVLGLPGNPVSSIVCGHVFLLPLVRALVGRGGAPEPSVRAVLGHDLSANDGPRTYYMRARLDRGTSPPTASTLIDQDSSLLSPLAAADGLLVREIGAPAMPAGTAVEIIPFEA